MKCILSIYIFNNNKCWKELRINNEWYIIDLVINDLYIIDLFINDFDI
jgi:hypothetical protein